MKKLINNTKIEGFLYEHDLKKKVSGPKSKKPGTEYISGSISIATDNDGVNIIPVHFRYVTAVTGNGKPSANFTILNNILEGKYKSIMSDGREQAVKLSVDSSVAVNDFYTDSKGKEELVTAKRNEGGFINVVNELNSDENNRNTFKCDIVINSVRRVEADPEKNLPEKAVIGGAVFGYGNVLIPVEFVALNPVAIDYFEGLGVTKREPAFTCVWGRQISQTIVKKIEEESAFGENSVREITSSRREWVIVGALKETYEWDDESTMTVAELNEMITARETHLATVKQQWIDYKNQNNAIPASPANTTVMGGFDF